MDVHIHFVHTSNTWSEKRQESTRSTFPLCWRIAYVWWLGWAGAVLCCVVLCFAMRNATRSAAAQSSFHFNTILAHTVHAPAVRSFQLIFKCDSGGLSMGSHCPMSAASLSFVPTTCLVGQAAALTLDSMKVTSNHRGIITIINKNMELCATRLYLVLPSMRSGLIAR
jgi:hypothetical protein